MPGLTLTGSVPSPVWTSYLRIILHASIPIGLLHTGAGFYFNPGLPEVKQYITNSVLEVVRNYDIDSVHLTITSISFPVSGEEFPDDAAFRTYGNGFGSKADWRRDNVNQLVKDLSHEIKSAKTYVNLASAPWGMAQQVIRPERFQIQER
ncbi:family 10 glycosylhydrolase [Paenibacillus larvae]|uniref:family 10 glycosylhydrolase n=1 Tax=Paenibacillus larvae TaxID=1464 RepID=UPI00288E357E|nr:family 10 glycosylhydrolase [Paenibacillus larvae]MDT2191607.1 family 10 glycosylhydrolase [Paenibacillus larvae]